MDRTTLPNGYYTLPPGKLANAVTWLDMRSKPDRPLAEPLRLTPLSDSDEALCRRLYAAIGTGWLWSRAYEAPSSGVGDTHAAQDEAGTPVGLVEFSGRESGEVEIAYFGLTPDATGRGLGRRMMASALDLAWRSASRVWLHTCNFDHPGALRFYRACGFEPFAAGFEIMDDPRVGGHVPIDAAPHVPLIGTAWPVGPE